MYQEWPDLIPKLVGILANPVREASRATTQTEKLAASGSAKQVFDCYRETLDPLAVLCASGDVYKQVQALETSASESVRTALPIDSLTRSDLEEEITGWLESIGSQDAWRGAPAFVNAGFTVERLVTARSCFTPEIRELALYRVAAAIEMKQVPAQMHNATPGMSDLEGAMRDYSFTDRSGAVEIDVNQNLLKICGNDGQLNPVWANLIHTGLEEKKTARPQLLITRSLKVRGRAEKNPR